MLAEVMAAAPATRLVVFPENPTPYAFDRDPAYRQLMTSMAAARRVDLLFNGIRYSGRTYYSSVFAVGPDGRRAGRTTSRGWCPSPSTSRSRTCSSSPGP